MAWPRGRLPDAATCPGSLDCALRRRARCPPGTHVCGPCLQPFQEDPQGLCVPRTRHPPVFLGTHAAAHRKASSVVTMATQDKGGPTGRGPPQPRLEDEIDFLAQELARQEARRSGVPRQQLLEPATLGLPEGGQRPEPGFPSPPGAATPTPRASLGSPLSSRPVQMAPLEPRGGRGDGLALVLIAACCVASVAALVVAALCWCRLQRQIRLTQKADYAAPPAPGSPSPLRVSPADQRLAQSAEMYHYQHQRQQMLCLERHKEPSKELDSASSDEENEDGDFTVYECPGLAPTGEMEVRNPLFDDSSLPAPPLQ
ncbi:neural proliferation differentiation and control protein 1 isoform X2 [Tamandua tetradactyla]|uniref:neural proliferation differentiation and control protein 1 isoform X2 n=1 Tax=Tamandua tetradactyla TaxID=48850 RepID=UPI004054282B